MDKKKLYYDILILGAGPAGLSAAIYAARGETKTAVIDISMFGGQPSNYLELENYPALGKIGGYEMMEKFENHADMFDIAKYPMQEIVAVNIVSTPKVIETKEYVFEAKSVIIATGAQAKKLEITGENEFLGRGVSYCAVCDGAFYKDKIVAVIGGGNAAVEEGCYLTKFAKKVYIIHRRNELRADKIVQERAFKNEKIEFLYDTIAMEIKGEDCVDTLVLKNTKNDEVKELKVNGVFPYIGFAPNTKYVDGQLEQDKSGFIVTDALMQTSVNGVYAVGDVRNTPLRQVITAAADGAVAGCYAVRFVEEQMYEKTQLNVGE